MLDLNKLGKGIKRGNTTQFVCPVCLEEGSPQNGNPHLGVDEKTGKFNCLKYSGDKGHNKRIIELVGLNSDSPPQETPEINETIQQERIFDPSILLKLLPIFDYWAARGISKETQKRFNLGLSMSGTLRMRMVHPIYNEKGQIHGFSGRLIKDNPKKPKYHHFGRKSMWLWPLHLNKQVILDKKEVIICEGAGDIFSLFEAGIENCLCCFGKNLSTKLLNRLISLSPNRIILGFNNDEAGKDACNQATERLRAFFSEDKIVCKLPTEGFKDLNDLILAKGTDGIKGWYVN